MNYELDINPFKIIENLLVGDNVSRNIVNKNSGILSLLEAIVIHYTGSNSLKSAYNTLIDPNVKACAHLIIDRDGKIVQLVPFNKITWHAGISKYKGKKGYNKYSIGIELVNVGYVTETNGVFTTWYGEQISPYEVINVNGRYWQTYTKEQINAVMDICKLLIANYPIKYILGHEEIAPKRKTDPGPAFPLDKIRNKLLFTDRETDVESFFSFLNVFKKV